MAKKAAPGDRAEERRTVFGQAVETALDGRSQAWLGAEVARDLGMASPISGSAVSQWIAGKTEPDPQRVFAIERALHLKPGTLSRFLGYLPLDAHPVLSVEDAIDADPRLTPPLRDAIRAAYRAGRSK